MDSISGVYFFLCVLISVNMLSHTVYFDDVVGMVTWWMIEYCKRCVLVPIRNVLSRQIPVWGELVTAWTGAL